MIISTVWQVHYGYGDTKNFPSLTQAKKFARDYEGAQISQNEGTCKYIRFISRNGRLAKVY